MARVRGQLQRDLLEYTDLFFWTVEKAIVVGAIGFAASVVKAPGLSFLHWLALAVLVVGAYVRIRQVLFKDLDEAQKAALTAAESLALVGRSRAALGVGGALIFAIQYFAHVMSLAVVH